MGSRPPSHTSRSLPFAEMVMVRVAKVRAKRGTYCERSSLKLRATNANALWLPLLPDPLRVMFGWRSFSLETQARGWLTGEENATTLKDE